MQKHEYDKILDRWLWDDSDTRKNPFIEMMQKGMEDRPEIPMPKTKSQINNELITKI